MFERRLKIFFAFLASVVGVLVLRAANLQLVNADYWRNRSHETLKRTTLVETARGRILDFRGRVVAVDEPCIDAAVDYRAIEKNPHWMRETALARISQRMQAGYRKAGQDARRQMIEEAIDGVSHDIDAMWDTLAAESGRSREDIEEIKGAIYRRVDFRRRVVWYKRYAQAMKDRAEPSDTPEPWYREFLSAETPAPELDNFNVEVAEQSAAHVILTAISTESHNRLKKHIEDYPGLVLRPSKHRYYPYQSVACHTIGNLSGVKKEDQDNDPSVGDELRQYLPTDLVGQSGVEALCERTLRGVRGRLIRIAGHDEVVEQTDAIPGGDVRLSLDMELQAQIENVFSKMEWFENGVLVESHPMHGAAVVIEVPTGQVRALVSYPTFDLNHYDESYSKMALDDINRPLSNRATQAALEPGSTVKPLVGIAAVCEGIITVNSTIECTGYLIIDGKKQKTGRCWVASKFASRLGDEAVKHHQLPYGAEHPTGFLTLVDAIQRSCNVFFETLADKLGLERLSVWMDRFGLGRPTGIGLPERSGQLPRSYPADGPERRSVSWFCGIGQAHVLATPIQMANVAATIARNGIWMRPKLVSGGAAAPGATEDRVDLHLDPSAVAAVKEGMWKVVNSRAGSGYDVRRPDIAICGKTGTAQAMKFSYIERDERGHELTDERGRPVRNFPEISTREKPNPAMPWYRGTGNGGTELSHAWFIGFAPAENPQIAFAVMLEYGGAGGKDAAPIVKALLEACKEHGYFGAQ
ncbi:MAG: penicillin-binding transpeptidase domain-containing protein [Tepidisphaeraceae bacterium]|jgi:penicillin-binding protein 2